MRATDRLGQRLAVFPINVALDEIQGGAGIPLRLTGKVLEIVTACSYEHDFR